VTTTQIVALSAAQIDALGRPTDRPVDGRQVAALSVAQLTGLTDD